MTKQRAGDGWATGCRQARRTGGLASGFDQPDLVKACSSAIYSKTITTINS